MQARRHGSRSSIRSPRRRLIWTEYDAVITFTANSQWFSLDTLQTYKAQVGNTLAKATVMRTHAALVHTAGAGNAGDRMWTGFRVADVDDTSGTVFTSANVANPRDNPYVDWAFMSRHSTDVLGVYSPSGIGGMAPGTPSAAVNYDLRSKRKLENLSDTWAFVVTQDNVTTVATTWHVFVRTLLALP